MSRLYWDLPLCPLSDVDDTADADDPYEQFLKGAASPDQNSAAALQSRASSSSRKPLQNDDVVEIKDSDPSGGGIGGNGSQQPAAIVGSRPNIPSDSDAFEAYLKSRLELACAAVLSRSLDLQKKFGEEEHTERDMMGNWRRKNTKGMRCNIQLPGWMKVGPLTIPQPVSSNRRALDLICEISIGASPKSAFEGVPTVQHGGDLHSSRDVTEVEKNDKTCAIELNTSSDSTKGEQFNKACIESKEEILGPNKSKRKAGDLSLNITYEQLELHFGKKLKDVAKELGVSRSTIKRACRDYGIIRGPHSKNKNNPSLFMASTQSNRVDNFKRQRLVDTKDNTALLPNFLLHKKPILDANKGKCNKNVAKSTKDGGVIIKATFGDDTVVFELDVSSKMNKLNQEVASRFDIEVGSFKLKYLDGDGDWIWMRGDSDLQFGMKKLKEMGRTTFKTLVQLV